MCPVRERQVEVTRITVVQKVPCAEAVKRVVEEDGSRVRDPKKIPGSRGNSMCFSNVGLLAFMTMVVKYTAGMERKITEDRCCGGSCREVLGIYICFILFNQEGLIEI
jgi:hypothetical protein